MLPPLPPEVIAAATADRIAQGLPERIVDPTAIARIAALVTARPADAGRAA